MELFIGFVYKWTNNINSKWYIGSHKGDINDGYIGSGKLFKSAIKKYGLNNFNREILYEGVDFREREEELLILLDAANDDLSYNLKNNTEGGTLGRKQTKEEIEKRVSKFRGIPRSDETKKRIADSKKNMSPETKRKMSESSKGKKHSTETKKRIAESCKGIKRSDISKKNISNGKLNAERSICPHCKSKGDIANMKRWHFDNCISLEQNKYKDRSRPSVTCPHCYKVGATGLMKRWHFDNCKYRTG